MEDLLGTATVPAQEMRNKHDTDDGTLPTCSANDLPLLLPTFVLFTKMY